MSDTRDQMDSRPQRQDSGRQDGDGAPEPRKDGEDRGPGGPRRGKGFFKKKVCKFCTQKIKVDYKDIDCHAPLRDGAWQDPSAKDHGHLRQASARARYRHQEGEGIGLPALRREVREDAIPASHVRSRHGPPAASPMPRYWRRA